MQVPREANIRQGLPQMADHSIEGVRNPLNEGNGTIPGNQCCILNVQRKTLPKVENTESQLRSNLGSRKCQTNGAKILKYGPLLYFVLRLSIELLRAAFTV